MKSIKLLSVLVLFFTVVLFQSCENDPCEDVTCLNDGICLDGTCDCTTGYSGANCGTHCSADIVGTWDVTNGQTTFCDFGKYEFTKGSTDTEILVSLTSADGFIVITGTGTLSLDCSSMTYTVIINSTSTISGTLSFDGTTFIDVTDVGCTLEATKQ